MNLDEMIATAVASCDIDQLNKIEEAIRARRSQLIHQRILSIPLYKSIRFRAKTPTGNTAVPGVVVDGLTVVPTGWRSGVVMRHLSRSVMVDAGNGKNIRVPYEDIKWEDIDASRGSTLDG